MNAYKRLTIVNQGQTKADVMCCLII